MGTIALGVFYLASPVAAAGAPPVGDAGGPPAEAPAPAPVTAPVEVEVASQRAAPRGYVIVDMPRISRLRVAFLDRDAVAAADRWQDEHAGDAAHAWRLDDGGREGTGGADPIADGGAIEDAVVAAHGQRIALLTERLASLTPGTATDQADDLRRRLRRAEAARKLAVARTAVQAITTCTAATDRACGAASAYPAPRAAPTIAKATTAARSARPVRADPRLAEARLTSPAKLHRATTIRGRAPVAIARTATRLDVRKLAGARRSAWRLAQARRSLAVARDLLRSHADDRATPRRQARVELALLQWPGSATWTLAAHHSWR